MPLPISTIAHSVCLSNDGNYTPDDCALSCVLDINNLSRLSGAYARHNCHFCRYDWRTHPRLGSSSHKFTAQNYWRKGGASIVFSIFWRPQALYSRIPWDFCHLFFSAVDYFAIYSRTHSSANVYAAICIYDRVRIAPYCRYAYRSGCSVVVADSVEYKTAAGARRTPRYHGKFCRNGPPARRAPDCIFLFAI